MITPVVDIFTKLPNGSSMWVEAVEGLDNARARVLSRLAPRDYVTYSEQIHREDHSNVHLPMKIGGTIFDRCTIFITSVPPARTPR